MGTRKCFTYKEVTRVRPMLELRFNDDVRQFQRIMCSLGKAFAHEEVTVLPRGVRGLLLTPH